MFKKFLSFSILPITIFLSFGAVRSLDYIDIIAYSVRFVKSFFNFFQSFFWFEPFGLPPPDTTHYSTYSGNCKMANCTKNSIQKMPALYKITNPAQERASLSRANAPTPRNGGIHQKKGLHNNHASHTANSGFEVGEIIISHFP
jgi:hypothetical protein